LTFIATQSIPTESNTRSSLASFTLVPTPSVQATSRFRTAMVGLHCKAVSKCVLIGTLAHPPTC